MNNKMSRVEKVSPVDIAQLITLDKWSDVMSIMSPELYWTIPQTKVTSVDTFGNIISEPKWMLGDKKPYETNINYFPAYDAEELLSLLPYSVYDDETNVIYKLNIQVDEVFFNAAYTDHDNTICNGLAAFGDTLAQSLCELLIKLIEQDFNFKKYHE